MIVKKMKRTSFKKSKAVMISELVDYIFSSHDDQGKEKLAHSGTLNFLTTTRAAQKNEMIALAEAEIRNAEATIPLVEADSRLGWEPSMEYIGDARHLRWKIKQTRQVIEDELKCYLKIIDKTL